MLCKLSLSNIRKSLRDYAIYFFTLIIGVSVFYVFNAIGSQAAMLRIEDDTHSIVELLKTMLSSVSVFVAGVLGMLIVYASRFLMKRRNKEFALYLMLGMSKGKISLILLTETIFIGIGSLAIGLPVGIGLSQLMSAVVANLFEADMTAYKFSVSGEAILKTIVYFAVMYVFAMIFNSVVVTKMKLIDLLQSGRKSEQVKLKNPVLCIIVFLLAAVGLGFAYYQVGWKYSNLNQQKLAAYIAVGAISTFLIFWSVSGMILRIVMSMKNTYYRSLNAFTFRQISSKVNTMVFSMTIICLMLFVTICTLTSAFSLRNTMNSNIRNLCPADFQISLSYNFENDNSDKKRISDIYSESGFDVTENVEEYTDILTYADSDLTLADFLGEKYDEIKKQYDFLFYEQAEEIITISDYNKLMEIYGKETLSLGDDEFIVLCDYSSMKNIRDIALSTDREINVFGHVLKSKYNECQNGFIELAAEHINTGIIVVPDSAADERHIRTEYMTGNYSAKNQEELKAISSAQTKRFEDVTGAFLNSYGEHAAASMQTRIDIGQGVVGLGAIVTFLGLYIGLVFLIACGVILALKELSESVDSTVRYEMLRKIGADEKEISKSLRRQTGIFFLLPLILACIHSVFGMKFSANVLEVFGTEGLWKSVSVTSIIILLIYGGYFLLTYYCSKNIIKQAESA